MIPNPIPLPGLALVAVIALLATLAPPLIAATGEPLAGLPLSPVLLAILGGLACAGLAQRRQPQLGPGLKLAAGPLLKLAVMLIGLRLSLAELGTLGVQAVPVVLAAVCTGLLLAWLLGRVLGVGDRLTALLAVGSAICGASAIAATAPAIKARPEETAYALACVALFGLAATILYPWLFGAWLPDGVQAGLALGAAIHDTAHVTAAALILEQAMGDPGVVAAATVTKLLRNLAMLAVIPAAAWWVLRGAEAEGGRTPFPYFILGFVALAGVRTAGDMAFGTAEAWQAVLLVAAHASAFLFAMAMAAIGMSIRLAALRLLGIRPAAVALLTALGIGTVALLIAARLG